MLPISLHGNSGFMVTVVVLVLFLGALIISAKNKSIAELQLNKKAATLVTMELEKSNLKEIKGEKDEIN